MKDLPTTAEYIINILVPPIKPDLTPNPSLNLILAQGRERILTAMLRVTAILGSLALLVILSQLIRYEQWASILIYVVCLGLVYFVALNRRIDYRLRAGVFLCSQYGVGLFDLVNYGLGEDGRIFLFGFSVTAIILLGAQVGMGALALSIATIAIIGWQNSAGQLIIFYTDYTDYISASALTIEDVIVLCADFLMTAGLVMAALHALLRDFDTAWRRERLATNQVEQERDLLEKRVAERTADLTAANTQLLQEVIERKQAEEALKQARDEALAANRLKSEILARVSHELRTPLGAILGFAEMLEAGVYGSISEKQRQGITQIIDSTHYLTGLVNELLDQAQLEADPLKLNLSSFRVVDVVEPVVSKMSVLAQAKGLTLATDIAAGVPTTLTGDQVRVQQILMNLVSNAVKFTQQGAVQIHLYRPNATHWALQVADTGPGIPVEAQIYIFEPFRQVDGSMTREYTGTGLGLSIVKQLTTLMGGQISLVSEVGHGSTFTVCLPLLLVPGKVA